MLEGKLAGKLWRGTRDRRRKQIDQLEDQAFLVAQMVKRVPPTFDIGLDTAAYADPGLTTAILEALPLYGWSIVRVHRRVDFGGDPSRRYGP